MKKRRGKREEIKVWKLSQALLVYGLLVGLIGFGGFGWFKSSLGVVFFDVFWVLVVNFGSKEVNLSSMQKSHVSTGTQSCLRSGYQSCNPVFVLFLH